MGKHLNVWLALAFCLCACVCAGGIVLFANVELALGGGLFSAFFLQLLISRIWPRRWMALLPALFCLTVLGLGLWLWLTTDYWDAVGGLLLMIFSAPLFLGCILGAAVYYGCNRRPKDP